MKVNFFKKSSKGLSEGTEGLCKYCHCVKGELWKKIRDSRSSILAFKFPGSCVSCCFFLNHNVSWEMAGTSCWVFLRHCSESALPEKLEPGYF